jgi:hypothetical protein
MKKGKNSKKKAVTVKLSNLMRTKSKSNRTESKGNQSNRNEPNRIEINRIESNSEYALNSRVSLYKNRFLAGLKTTEIF